jgi:transposase-like protein
LKIKQIDRMKNSILGGSDRTAPAYGYSRWCCVTCSGNFTMRPVTRGTGGARGAMIITNGVMVTSTGGPMNITRVINVQRSVTAITFQDFSPWTMCFNKKILQISVLDKKLFFLAGQDLFVWCNREENT